METKAVLRNLRMAPRKVRLVVDLVRGMNAQDAIAQLRFSPKHAAIPVRKLIESALANAVHNHSMKADALVISTAFVDQGAPLKRWTPKAFGRANPIRKHTSHVTILLSGPIDTALVAQRAKEAEAARTKAEKAEKAAEKKAAEKKAEKKSKESTK